MNRLAEFLANYSHPSTINYYTQKLYTLSQNQQQLATRMIQRQRQINTYLTIPPAVTAQMLFAYAQQQTSAKEKLTHLLAAGECGHIHSQYTLAQHYAQDQQWIAAAYWYNRAAETGHIEAQYQLGWCYYHGLGVAQDYCQAVCWYQWATESGHSAAQLELSRCYQYGHGVQKNLEQAFDLMYELASADIAAAQYQLGLLWLDQDDYKNALYWLNKAAKLCHVAAYYRLGLCYYYGQGVVMDNLKAVEWFSKAANQGDAAAQYQLGLCYYYGYGVWPDAEMAITLFQQAATQGHAEAQAMLVGKWSL